MLRMIKYSLLMAMLILVHGCGQEEELGTGSIYVKNNSVFFSINTVNIKPSDQTDWGVNRLVDNYLGTTQTVSLTGLEPCNTRWDVRAVFSDSQIRKALKIWLSCGGSIDVSVNY